MELNLEPVLNETSKNSAELDSIVTRTVASYTAYLDQVMTTIYQEVISISNPATEVIEKHFLELSNAIYFSVESVEKLGMLDGISKASAQQKYNTFYMEHQASNVGVTGAKKPTVAESTAYAENETLPDTMVNEVYNRAYKILRGKVDAAQTMVSTLSKILSRRMSEAQLSATVSNRRILNEGDIV